MFTFLEALVVFAIGILAYIFCEIVKHFVKNVSIWICLLILFIIAIILIIVPYFIVN